MGRSSLLRTDGQAVTLFCSLATSDLICGLNEKGGHEARLFVIAFPIYPMNNSSSM
jgi:hypothetical protein